MVQVAWTPPFRALNTQNSLFHGGMNLIWFMLSTEFMKSTCKGLDQGVPATHTRS